jgi:autotransporter-associated beta strand protein
MSQPTAMTTFASRFASVVAGGLLVALLPTSAPGQTTIGGSYTSTPWDNTAPLTTGSGLTVNLGLGVEFLLVGGGGSGGGGHAGGGGGGGGVLAGSTAVAAGTYFIGVGTGGGQSTGRGNSGTTSTAFTFTASGGGGGAGELAGATAQTGGSGGGGSGSNLSDNRAGGSGTSGQGNVGGAGATLPSLSYGVAGGGGGAGQAGFNATSTEAGNGGAGVVTTIRGTTEYFGGGGGGGGWGSQNVPGGGGGEGGGAAGASGTTSVAPAGTANTGGGGGGSSASGSSSRTGGAGGSGIVIFRYQSGTRLASGGDGTTTGDWQVETVTSNRNVTVSYAAANLLATQSGVISGTGALTFNNAGTLALSAANTFSGKTRVQAGTLNLANVLALQNSTLDLATADTGTLGLTVAGTASYTVGGLSGSRNLALSGNSLVVGGNGDSTSYSGNLSAAGSGSLTKAGAGTLTLSGSNTLPGGVELAAGTLTVGSAGAIDSAGTISFTGGTLRSSAANTTDYSSRFSTTAGQQYRIDTAAESITLSTPLTSDGGALVKTGAGTLTLGGANTYSGGTTVSAGRLVGTTTSLQGTFTNNAILRFDQATTGSFTGSISGAGAVEKNGAGTVVLAAANSHAGGTTVNAGTLAVTANDALGTPGASAGVIFGTGVGTNPGSGTARDANWLLVAVPSSWTPPASVPYPAYVVQTVPDTFVGGATGGVQNGYTADGTTSYWIAPQSTVNALVGGSYNWIVAQEFNVVRDGVYSFSFGGAGDDQISFFINGTVNTSSSVLPTITGGTQIGSTYASFSTIGTLSGTANLLAGTHTAYMVLNDFGGGTGAIITPGTFTPPEGTIVHAGSTLDLRNVAYATADRITLNGATLATSTGSSSWAGSVVLGAASTVDVTGAALGILGAVSGTGSLTKTGGGNLILSGTNNYAGPTSISAGRLSVNGALGNSPVTVLAAAELGGSGSIAGTVAVQAGGRVSPGNSIGVLTQGDTTFDGGAIFRYEVDSSDLAALGTAADLLVVTGNLNIATGTLLEFSDLAGLSTQPFVENTTVFAMINYTGTWNTGLFTYNTQTLANGSRFMVGSQMWEIDYAYVYDTVTPGSTIRPLNFQGSHQPGTGTQTFVTITAVPEPSTFAMALAGLACGGYVVRRRRKRA